MRPHRPPPDTDGTSSRAVPSVSSRGTARGRSGGPSAPPDHLRLVPTPSETESFAQRDHDFILLQRHLTLAMRLGVAPLTVVERAHAMLDTACDGWRSDGTCIGNDAEPRDEPHDTCVLAQYHHDLLLLEHGLLPIINNPESRTR